MAIELGTTVESTIAYVEPTSLPTTLPDFVITIPSGRPNQVSQLLHDIQIQHARENPTSGVIALISLAGRSSPEEIATALTTVPQNPDLPEIPVYIMTTRTNYELFERLLPLLPAQIRNNPILVDVARDLVTQPWYGNQRTKLMLPFSTHGESGHSRHIDLSLDDDLAIRPIPIVTSLYAQQHNIPIEPNGAVYLPRGESNMPSVATWQDQSVFQPYYDAAAGTLPSNTRTARDGINTQNDALAQGVYATFVEDHDPQSPPIADPNARFLLAFGRKWDNPDVEAFYKLRNDTLSGEERPQLGIESIFTSIPETIGIQTNPVNMDTAHMARFWQHEVADMVTWLVSNPKISARYGTMAFRDGRNGKQKAMGMRAEMCLLIGPDGLLKQISDTLGKTYLAAQVSSAYEHRRLATKRASEAVATFSEFLGMNMAEIVRASLIVDPNDMTVTMRDISKQHTVIAPQTVAVMYEQMKALCSEIDQIVGPLQNRTIAKPGQDATIEQLLYTKADIQRRLRMDGGFKAFFTAVNDELKEQLNYQRMVMDVHAHLLRAGAQLRKAGQFPVMQLVQ